MAWKKVSLEMCDLLEEILSAFDCEKRKMFGCPAYYVNDTWFAGVHEANILIRLSEIDRSELKTKYHDAANFEPTKGRPMKEFMILPERIYSNEKEFNRWLNLSINYARALPPRKKKSRKKK